MYAYADPLSIATQGKVTLNGDYLPVLGLSTLGKISFADSAPDYRVCLIDRLVKTSPELNSLMPNSPTTVAGLAKKPLLLASLENGPSVAVKGRSKPMLSSAVSLKPRTVSFLLNGPSTSSETWNC